MGNSQPTNTVWYWNDRNDWIKLEQEDSKSVEKEYQTYLNNTRCGSLVYHCFGDTCTALIDFDKMETFCGSGRCKCKYSNDLESDHMTYKLKRNIE